MASDLDGLKPAIATVQVDNAGVRVTRWNFPPRTETGWHKHGLDYVVVPTLPGTLTIVGADGARRDYEYVAGESYHRTRGAEHNVVNLGDGTVEFVEIELKDA
jgi:quercetin dioxygenase-like cupin family protein